MLLSILQNSDIAHHELFSVFDHFKREYNRKSLCCISLFTHQLVKALMNTPGTHLDNHLSK